MTTKTQKQLSHADEDEAIRAAEVAAREQVEAAEHAAAAAAAARAEFEGRQHRQAMEALSAEIVAESDPAALVEAIDQAAAAIAHVIRVIEGRNMRLSNWIGQARGEGVPQTPHNGPRRPVDLGFGWRPAASDYILLTGTTVLRPLRISELLDGVVARGVRAAGRTPMQIGAGTGAPAELADDPGKWLSTRW